MRRTLPPSSLFECYQKDFLFYERVRARAQQPKESHKIYALHEPHVYCIGKAISSMSMVIKASIACTAKSNLIVGVVSHELNLHDSHTLPQVLKHIEQSRGKGVKTAVCDRGYRGKKEVNGTRIMLPSKGLKRDNRYQRDKKRKQCKRRAAIDRADHWSFKAE